MSTVDLSTLPPPEVIETLSFEALLAEIKDYFLSIYPEAAAVLDLESEPLTKAFQAFAYRELGIRARYNDEARALLLAYATGTNLDHLGATYYQEARLVVTPEDNTTIPPTPAVMESDNDYRYRLALKPESYSVAGPTDAYKFHALSADGQIKGASVTSPQPGTTQIYVLTRTGSGIPGAPLLATVAAAVNAEAVRPLSEEVIVSAASIIDYTLDIDLTLFAGPSTEPVVAAVQAALEQFAADNHQIATDIIRSAIDAAAHVAGVKKVVINSPAADIDCGPGQAAYCTGITITIAAVE